jgi:hypothetical protein
MKSEKAERLTVLVRRKAEELMRKERRPVSVSEIQCYMSKVNPELSREVSGKSVDYVRAVLGTSRVGRFRKFRCPRWEGLGSGESPRKPYCGECGVRYEEKWERESGDASDGASEGGRESDGEGEGESGSGRGEGRGGERAGEECEGREKENERARGMERENESERAVEGDRAERVWCSECSE